MFLLWSPRRTYCTLFVLLSTTTTTFSFELPLLLAPRWIHQRTTTSSSSLFSSSTTTSSSSIIIDDTESTEFTATTPSDSLLPPPPLQRQQNSKRNQRQASPEDSSLPELPSSIPSLSQILHSSTSPKKKINRKPTQKKAAKRAPNAVSSPAASSTSTRRTSSYPQPHKQKRSRSRRPRLPWQADYQTSLRSQSLIQQSPPHAAISTLLGLPTTACNGANMVCALTRTAKASHVVVRHSTLHAVCRELQHVLTLHNDSNTYRYFSPRQLANIVWALAKIYDRDHTLQMTSSSSSLQQHHSPDGWTLLQDDTNNNNDDGDSDDTLISCLDTTIDMLADTIADTLLSPTTTTTMQPQELCMTAWAYGILRRRPSSSTTAMVPPTTTAQRHQDADSGIRYLELHQPWSSSSTTGFGHAQQQQPIPTERETTITPTHRVWDALTTALLLSEEDQQVVLLHHCQWREVANVVWALAVGRDTDHVRTVLAPAIAHATVQRLQQDDRQSSFLTRDIAQILWSLGVVVSSSPSSKQHHDMSEDVVNVMDTFLRSNNNNNNDWTTWSCADLVQVAMTMAHVRYNAVPAGLYAAAAARNLATTTSTNNASQHRTSFFAWELSILLWAQARLYLTDQQQQHTDSTAETASPSAFQLFTTRAMEQLDVARRAAPSFVSMGVGPQEQANIVWSITVLQHEGSVLTPAAGRVVRDIFAEAEQLWRESNKCMQPEHAHQLWQALFLLEREQGEGSEEYFTSVSNSFRQYLYNEWQTEKARPKISSARHCALSKTLDLMGVAHYNEHDEDIDVAIVLQPDASWTHETVRGEMQPGVRVAVEFDGPTHFTRQSTAAPVPRALGHTMLKYRLLKQQGWSVVRVPYYEFDKIPFWASMERQRYLQRLLKTHGNIRFSDVDVSEYKPAVANRQSRFD